MQDYAHMCLIYRSLHFLFRHGVGGMQKDQINFYNVTTIIFCIRTPTSCF